MYSIACPGAGEVTGVLEAIEKCTVGKVDLNILIKKT